MKTVWFVLAAVVAAPSSVMAQPSVSRSHFEPGPCAVEVATDERIDCGVLVAPENRRAANSRMIRLPVMIFRSRAEAPAADPVMFLTGGPGNSALSGQRSGKSNPFLERRDQVLLEPRGAKLAQPALECPQINLLKVQIALGAVRVDAAEEQLVRAAADCREVLTAAGADLNGYNSAEAADDIEDLRVALGYPQVNLYALSYGTRLALTMARRHPASVRAMVLDSVLPPEVNYDEAAAANVRRALNQVFDGCAVDPVCARAWPGLRHDFEALVARADRDGLPLVVGERRLDARGAQVVEAVGAALGDPKLIPLIPRAIGQAAKGDHAELGRWLAQAQTPSGFAWGQRLSVWCREEAPFEDEALVAAQTEARQGLGGRDGRTASPAMCRVWNVEMADAIENQPVKTDIPTLILAGQFDPATPPQWGRRLLVNMPKALFVELPGFSHGASFNRCGGRMAFDFINTPETSPNLTCVAALPGVDFGLSAAPTVNAP